ncbi:hypothetical protein PFISCL1PPCAC_13855, partial [Pristionchus fissidentatus]
IFVVFRTLAASASAGFGVLTPVTLAHLFQDRTLGVALMIMSACEALSGLVTAIISSSLVASGVSWKVGLLPGPVITVLPALGLLCLMKAFMFWIAPLILSAWSAFPEVFLNLSYPSVTALNALTMLSGSMIGLPSLLWLAQEKMQSWNHGTGPFAGRKGYERAYPVVVAAG